MQEQTIIGSSLALTEVLEQVSALAEINRPVLVLGERGTGKELIAQRLHFLSPRWQRNLVKVNCAALNDNLLESELFGHQVGAFTGATKNHKGRFERADGGTLMLDELGTMSLHLQEKLLRVLEYGEFEPLGSHETKQVDVRVIGATSADLQAMAAAGTFRYDLLDRLAFDVVHLPPLRLRKDDILELAQHFAQRMGHELGWELFSGFSLQARQQLVNHSWYGNVRELRNVVERSLYRWGQANEPVPKIYLDVFSKPRSISPEHDTEHKSDYLSKHSAAQASQQADIGDFRQQVERYEFGLLQTALAQHQHHQSHTAHALGLSYHQLRGLLKKHKLAKSQGHEQGHEHD
jgi:psp operon transcriptional activator